MAKLSHNLEYLLALTGISLAQLLSPRVADSFAAGLGSFAHAILTSRRRIAIENLARAMGDTLSAKEIEAITRRVFQNTGRTLVEFSRFGKCLQTMLDDYIVDDGLEHMQAVHDEGHGVVIVVPHFGSWELFGAWVATRGFPMDIITGVQHNEKVDRLLRGFRTEIGVGMIPVNRSVRGVFKSLKANRFVGLISDQHAPSGVVVKFFGRPAATPKGPAAFAVKAGAPVLPFMMRRERYDRHVVMAGEPIKSPASGDDEADIVAVTQEYTKFFESCIRQYPDQWLWTHRRWKV